MSELQLYDILGMMISDRAFFFYYLDSNMAQLRATGQAGDLTVLLEHSAFLHKEAVSYRSF